MTKAATFKQRDVQAAIAGAIAAGLTPGTFAVVISAKTGDLKLVPAKLAAAGDDGALQDELEGFTKKNGLD